MESKTEKQKNIRQTMLGAIKSPAFFPSLGAGIGCLDWGILLNKGHKKSFAEGFGRIFLLTFAGFGVSKVADPLLSNEPLDTHTKQGLGAGAFIGLTGVNALNIPYSISPGRMIYMTLVAAFVGAGLGKAASNHFIDHKQDLNSSNKNSM